MWVFRDEAAPITKGLKWNQEQHKQKLYIVEGFSLPVMTQVEKGFQFTLTCINHLVNICMYSQRTIHKPCDKGSVIYCNVEGHSLRIVHDMLMDKLAVIFKITPCYFMVVL